ncbi:3-isopropylmalate dehydrogenase [Cyclobacterium sp. 1_MG-2023]|uniref:3-isopropylmalate dehydrogenase n=1 Tax=Cyclobacterium sp. 1_MG-2023 TaxID=3062681 RepID=UPI0026E20ECE|nr:3-isopropylmalate dehydrogenase [Cyclobacterium sp. 1_MG-2023]MDO6439955.1 3-isopropylmalate dehydrogenase [Cyclobacterium sp. 1_MG-2023]
MEMNIALLPGDGIGPEVINQAVKVVDAVAKKFGHKITYNEAITGAAAIDAVGNPYPDATHDACVAADAVLFGAIGHPKFDNDPSAKVRPEQGLLEMRKKLGLFSNVRPTFTFPSLLHKSPLKKERIEGTDLVFLRELTGGIYFGEPRGRNEQGTKAFDSCVYSVEEIERLARMGFEFARKRRKLLTCVDKANVLATSRLWRETVQRLAPEYPDVKVEYEFVDAVAMRLVQWPKAYDVLITENLFGDILTDEASVISGSMGLMPSASIGLKTKLFEPIHGSYPQAAGKDIANPLAAVLSASMMFEYAFDLMDEAKAISDVVNLSLEKGVVTEDLSEGEKSYKTSEVGDWLAEQIEKM